MSYEWQALWQALNPPADLYKVVLSVVTVNVMVYLVIGVLTGSLPIATFSAPMAGQPNMGMHMFSTTKLTSCITLSLFCS